MCLTILILQSNLCRNKLQEESCAWFPSQRSPTLTLCCRQKVWQAMMTMLAMAALIQQHNQLPMIRMLQNHHLRQLLVMVLVQWFNQPVLIIVQTVQQHFLSDPKKPLYSVHMNAKDKLSVLCLLHIIQIFINYFTLQ